MAYYDALIAAWNNPTQPPPGVTGAPLTSGMTTQKKLDTVNAWTVTGAIPASFYTDGAEVLNALVWTEFKTLTAAQQQNVLNMLSIAGQLLSGTANVTKMLPGMILEYFPAGTTSRKSRNNARIRSLTLRRC